MITYFYFVAKFIMKIHSQINQIKIAAKNRLVVSMLLVLNTARSQKYYDEKVRSP